MYSVILIVEPEKKVTEIHQPRHADPEALSLSRTRSWLGIAPYTEDRLDVEAELSLERTQD
jgi:DHA1 family multidrug resistance protein-like MFS transporter